MPKTYTDPGPLPEAATPTERQAWSKANEAFLTEGGRRGAAKSPAKVDATDARLKELRRDHTRFMEMRSPAKAALWLALSLPAKDILHKAEMTRRFVEAQRGTLEPGQAFVAPEDSGLVEMMNTAAARAILGDSASLTTIIERIEGKVGVRVDDVDPEDHEQKKKTQAMAQDLVRMLTEAAVQKRAGDDAKVVDVEPALDNATSKE